LGCFLKRGGPSVGEKTSLQGRNACFKGEGAPIEGKETHSVKEQASMEAPGGGKEAPPQNPPLPLTPH